MHRSPSQHSWWRWWLQGDSLGASSPSRSWVPMGSCLQPCLLGVQPPLVGGHRSSMVDRPLRTPCTWGQEGGMKGFPPGQGLPPAGSTCCYVCVCAMCACVCRIS